MAKSSGSNRSRQKNLSATEPEAPKTRWAKGEWWEWVLIIVSVLALWPKILSWPGIIWDIVLFTALGLMIWVFVRRSKRLRREWKGGD